AVKRNKTKPNNLLNQQDMTEEFETVGVRTGPWWSFPNGMFSGLSQPHSTEISIDIGGFEWQNIDNIDAETYDKSYTSTLSSNTNLDSTSQVNAWNQYNHREEERFDPISSFLEGLFDNSELSVPSVKRELLESFHFFEDVFLNESRTVSVFDHEIGDKHEEENQAWKSLITCKRTSEKTKDLEDIESLPPLKRPRLETPTQFPSFKKVRKEKLGDRITALQQLVSPFGKTDTASVLHDAIEYIKFLREQITVSSNPQLNSKGSGEQKQRSYNGTHAEDSSPRQDLRSRGLCLMPISSTFSTSPLHFGLI
ncbi:unnamed protein product, partial [Brassica oleracea var. botrytis]